MHIQYTHFSSADATTPSFRCPGGRHLHARGQARAVGPSVSIYLSIYIYISISIYIYIHIYIQYTPFSSADATTPFVP